MQCWPTFSLVRSDADACSVTVKFGSVSERIGVPGGSGSPSFTNTCPMRIGQLPTIMSVGWNTTSFWIERSVDRHRRLARRAAAWCRRSGSKSWPGCAVPTTW